MEPLDLSSVIVVIPALNEERSLPRVLTDLPEVKSVIVVDNGSTDRTAEVARAGGADVVWQPERGYGAACLAGIARAQERGADVLVILDADYSDYSEDIGLLAGPVLRDEADLVMGDRTANAQRGSLPPQQRIGNRLATFLIGRNTGHYYRDMGPFRAIRMTSLMALQMEDRTWGWNVEMQMKALHHKMRVLEIPVRYRPRIGTSKISGTVQGTLRAGTRILLSVRRYRS